MKYLEKARAGHLQGKIIILRTFIVIKLKMDGEFWK